MNPVRPLVFYRVNIEPIVEIILINFWKEV